ncbi:MAG: lipocalin-like domain-containing protein [Vampirovibrionales bacterium]|nr:lipocalin-like domain-containing protein [Vampirovibrionales bacterium]
MAVFLGLNFLPVASWAANAPNTPTSEFRQALPGYRYQFPADHASHPAFKTEWWYYTGHLRAASGRQYGYELTFFRIGNPSHGLPGASRWALKNSIMAHLALTDISGKRFYYQQALARAGYSAGASTNQYHVWLKDWSVVRSAKTGHHVLRAKTDAFALALTLAPLKPPAIHGENGVSQKASCLGCASHYYSYTRMQTRGTLTLGGTRQPVVGQSWMDHEFGSNQLTREQVGWDWFSLQLSEADAGSKTLDKAPAHARAKSIGSDLMLYNMRLKNGQHDAQSSGSWVAPDGRVTHLRRQSFSITPLAYWQSPSTRGRYPMQWRVLVPELALNLLVTPVMQQQELVLNQTQGLTYWEGAVRVSGTRGGKKLTGLGYVEMTGYAQRFKQSI